MPLPSIEFNGVLQCLVRQIKKRHLPSESIDNLDLRLQRGQTKVDTAQADD